MKQAERIFILPRNAEGQQDLKIITLPHPRTGAAARFMVRSGQVLEIQKVTERYRCWFKDNYVHKDGSLFIATEVDPLFLLLPLLEKNRKQTSESAGYFCEKDQILTEDFEAYPGYAHFLEWPTLPLGLVCDTKDAGGGRVYYRLDNSKVVKWLQAKVHKMKAHLAASPDLAGSLRGGARAANYRDSTPLTDAELTKAAIGFISDYINNDWQTKLCEAYGLPPVHIPTEKSAALAQNTGQSAAEKHSFGGNAEVYEWEQDEISKYAYDGGAAKTAESKTPQKSLAQKKLEKVDKSGMKTLTSFFAVKKKE